MAHPADRHRPKGRVSRLNHWHPKGRAGTNRVLMSSDSEPSDSRVMLQIPAEPAYLELARTTVGRVAHMAGFTFDGIEDIALAVDEAAILLLESDPDSIGLDVQAVDGLLTIIISAVGVGGQWPPAEIEADTRWLILSTISESSWVIDGENPGIGLSQSRR